MYWKITLRYYRPFVWICMSVYCWFTLWFMLKFLVILGTCILRYLDIFGSILRFVAICLGMTQVLSIFGVQHVEFGILGGKEVEPWGRVPAYVAATNWSTPAPSRVKVIPEVLCATQDVVSYTTSSDAQFTIWVPRCCHGHWWMKNKMVILQYLWRNYFIVLFVSFFTQKW